MTGVQTCALPISSHQPINKHSRIISIVLYKLPGSSQYTRITESDTPKSFASLDDVPLTGGYVVMPFISTPSAPIVFIEPDTCTQHPLRRPQTSASIQLHFPNLADERSSYAEAFTRGKSLLTDGSLQKIVLSRRLSVEAECDWDREELFLRACHNRPNSFVTLWSTPQTGTWLVATPEPLLRKSQDAFTTVALAGTQPYLPGQEEGSALWSEKNKKEQDVVARFVENILREEADHVVRSERHTLRYGNIQHLCTDFSFTLKDNELQRRLLQRLHPTPAVCGLPQYDTRNAILQAESSPRRYYAGFSGPLNLQGQTHLFVSLRCMQLFSSRAVLYAGGGVMPESTEQEEWDETCRKLETMLEVLRG